MAGSQWVVEGTYHNFQEEVVERSRHVPVVVDFWAPWCGPCRALGPVLEALAAEKKGQFVLVKVNTDESPDLAQAFQVSGIPAVFAIRNGKLVDRFEGVLPEPEVRKFIDAQIGAQAADPAVNALELEGRDPKAAVAAYRGMLAANADDPQARLGLARVLLATPGNEAEANNLLSGVDFADQTDEAERLKTVIRLREVPHADADLASARAAASANPQDAQARYRLGQVLAARGEYLPALGELLATAEEDRALGRTTIRELMVSIFQVIGPQSPETDEYRRKLQNVLY
jgi:putative thioredoxin